MLLLCELTPPRRASSQGQRLGAGCASAAWLLGGIWLLSSGACVWERFGDREKPGFISQDGNAYGLAILGKNNFLSTYLFGHILVGFIFGAEQRLCGQREPGRRRARGAWSSLSQLKHRLPLALNSSQDGQHVDCRSCRHCAWFSWMTTR